MPLNKGNSSIFVPTVKWKSPLKYAQPLWSCLSLKNKGPKCYHRGHAWYNTWNKIRFFLKSWYPGEKSRQYIEYLWNMKCRCTKIHKIVEIESFQLNWVRKYILYTEIFHLANWKMFSTSRPKIKSESISHLSTMSH